MDIILVSNRFAKARSLTLKGRHLLLIILMGWGLFFSALFAAQYFIMRFHPDSLSPEMRAWLAARSGRFASRGWSVIETDAGADAVSGAAAFARAADRVVGELGGWIGTHTDCK